ncbi:MAG: hypothetical protein ABI856_20165 [Nitrospira sp.]
MVHATSRSLIGILIGVFLCSTSWLSAEELSAPVTQESRQDTSGHIRDIQERAIRQGAGAGQGAQCVCEHALGQCVFNAFGCVPHQGNPCNGGCVMKQPNSSIGGAARGQILTAPPGTTIPGASTR